MAPKRAPPEGPEESPGFPGGPWRTPRSAPRPRGPKKSRKGTHKWPAGPKKSRKGTRKLPAGAQQRGLWDFKETPRQKKTETRFQNKNIEHQKSVNIQKTTRHSKQTNKYKEKPLVGILTLTIAKNEYIILTKLVYGFVGKNWDRIQFNSATRHFLNNMARVI